MSLLFGVAIAALWVISYWAWGRLHYDLPVGASKQRSITISSQPGRIVVHTVWAKFEVYGHDRYVREWNRGQAGGMWDNAWGR